MPERARDEKIPEPAQEFRWVVGHGDRESGDHVVRVEQRLYNNTGAHHVSGAARLDAYPDTGGFHSEDPIGIGGFRNDFWEEPGGEAGPEFRYRVKVEYGGL